MTLSLEEKLACSADKLYLSVRASNLLKNQGIRTIRDLVGTDARQMLSIQGCGKKTVAELIARLKMVGLKMENSDNLFPDAEIESRITSIRESLAALREPKQKIESYRDKRAKDIKQKRLIVMLMRANGTPFKKIAEVVGRTEGSTRNYFSRFARSLVWEADRRKVAVSDVLAENDIPLSALELIRKEGLLRKTTEGMQL